MVERWQEEPASVRAGATHKRGHTGSLQPVRVQDITIVQDTTTDPASYQVTRGDIVLPLNLLFLRDPTPQESNVIITVAELEEIADAILETVV